MECETTGTHVLEGTATKKKSGNAVTESSDHTCAFANTIPAVIAICKFPTQNQIRKPFAPSFQISNITQDLALFQEPGRRKGTEKRRGGVEEWKGEE